MKKQYTAPDMYVGENEVILSLQSLSLTVGQDDPITNSDEILAPRMDEGENVPEKSVWGSNW